MKFLAIKQNRSGKNVEFLNDGFKVVNLLEAYDYTEKGVVENVKAVVTKSNKKYLRSVGNKLDTDNLDAIAITCNDTDYLFFDRNYLYLRGGNHKSKRKWKAFSGSPDAKISDQTKKDFGPLPEGEYEVLFNKTLEYKDNTGFIDAVLWKIRSGSWGYIVTPLKQVQGLTYDRGDFYIHGGKYLGTKGCIELNGELNKDFHAFLSLYARNFKLVVKY